MDLPNAAYPVDNLRAVWHSEDFEIYVPNLYK
jgi:hypothetical protein